MDAIRGMLSGTAQVLANGGNVAIAMTKANPFAATGILAATVGTVVTLKKTYTKYSTEAGKAQGALNDITGINGRAKGDTAAVKTKGELALFLGAAANKALTDKLAKEPKYINVAYTASLAQLSKAVADLNSNESTIATELNKKMTELDVVIASTEKFIQEQGFSQIKLIEVVKQPIAKKVFADTTGDIAVVKHDLQAALAAVKEEKDLVVKNNAISKALDAAAVAMGVATDKLTPVVEDMRNAADQVPAIDALNAAYAKLIGEVVDAANGNAKTTQLQRMQAELNLDPKRAINAAGIKAIVDPITASLTAAENALTATAAKDKAVVDGSKVRVAAPMMIGFALLAAAFAGRYFGPQFNVAWIK